jgi:hypothetical protein
MKRSYVVFASVLLAAALLITGFAAPAALAQDESPVTVDSARPVTEIVGEKSAYLATVSPDGNYIAWGKQSGRGRDRVLQLCIFEFETAAKQCSDLSPDLFDGYPYQFQWSPDSSMIAFSETPPEIGSESDIWLFDREAGSFTNLTDDGLVGLWNYINADGEQSVLDYLPMWNAADGQIYFWRVVPLGNFRYTIGIYRIAPEGGEAEQVRDLTLDFATQVPIFDYEHLFLDGISALSPDGNTVAVIMTSFDDMGATTQSLYTIDLADDAAEPQLLMGLADFQSVRPEWAQDLPPQVLGLSWTGDGAGVVVVSYNEVGPTMPFETYQYVDVASGEITPVVDFSGLEEMEDYGEPAPGSDLPWRLYSPWTASLSPDGDKLLMVNDLGGTVALFTAPLPPTGDLPTVSASADESPISGAATASRGEGGKVLAYGLLMTITEE